MPLATAPNLANQGVWPSLAGIRYTTWAPDHSVAVLIANEAGDIIRELPLTPDGNGFHSGTDAAGRVGDLYLYELSGETVVPDIASRYQPQGVEGPSQVVDLAAYEWQHPLPSVAMEELVIYELHVGTFTPEGTLRAAAKQLPYLKHLGITAVELMPLGAFPGARNWGYDCVKPYALAEAYGQPGDLQAFVDAAHGLGLAVIADVIYNHLGPQGNHFALFSPFYFKPGHETPWGGGLNFDGENSAPVRDFFRANAEMWLDDYRFDGLRLDAIHAIADSSEVTLVTEIATLAHARGRFVIGEDERNLAAVLRTPASEGLDAVWADDLHHSLRVAVSKNRDGYFANFTGSMAELAETFNAGWLYKGQETPTKKQPRGTPCEHLPTAAFVQCLSNHDQVGNRPLGERLHHLLSPEAYRAASALLCLTPYTPLIFMGQEWAASSPFCFFTDLANLETPLKESRAKEFAGSGFNYDAETLAKMPDPQNPATFYASKLNWDESKQPNHSGILKLYETCLRLRRVLGVRSRQRENFHASALGDHLLAIRFQTAPSEAYLLLSCLRGGFTGALPNIDYFPWPNATLILATNEARYGGNSPESFDRARAQLDFAAPETLLFKATH